jgi:arylsulfatase A-like enzyme
MPFLNCCCRHLEFYLRRLWLSEKPPNVVLIVSDDQGYGDLGCFGSNEVKAPHLDRLSEGGVKLTGFYVAWPACTPSRGALLTGRYPQRNGIYDMIRNEAPDYAYQYKPGEYEATFERIGGMDRCEILLPAVLGKAGYVSGIYGKWDLGVRATTQDEVVVQEVDLSQQHFWRANMGDFKGRLRHERPPVDLPK